MPSRGRDDDYDDRDDRPRGRRRDRDDDDFEDDDRPRRRRNRDYDDDDDYEPRPAAALGDGRSNAAGLTLSIIGLVLGTLSLLLSFIPCVGALALWPGIVSIVLSGIGLVTSVRAKALPITAVAVSALSIGFAVWQRSRVEVVLDEGQKALQKERERQEQLNREKNKLDK